MKYKNFTKGKSEESEQIRFQRSVIREEYSATVKEEQTPLIKNKRKKLIKF